MIQPSDFHYDLPPESIAQTPCHPRDAAKLMVLNRHTQSITHTVFSRLTDYLTDRCVLVLNDSKVFPARLLGQKTTGGRVEILLLEPTAHHTWKAMAKGCKKGQKVIFNHALIGRVIQKDEATGHIEISLELSNNSPYKSLDQAMDELGRTPIPPYIHSPLSESVLRQEYQTVYADQKGSAAAPTAGLHFTPKLLTQLEQQGIQLERVTLHVGPGTFAKLHPKQITSKTLHHEWYHINEATAKRLNQAKAAGKRIVAVGTTACRTLESAAENGMLQSTNHELRTTNLFIIPPYQFKFTDALITNFHLPESSLLMLVTAFGGDTQFDASLIQKAYQTAIAHHYRFFSFGDAMLIE